jgi:hypothetical protein
MLTCGPCLVQRRSFAEGQQQPATHEQFLCCLCAGGGVKGQATVLWAAASCCNIQLANSVNSVVCFVQSTSDACRQCN